MDASKKVDINSLITESSSSVKFNIDHIFSEYAKR